jgi:RNA polymerase sigma-70 factor (ECF subfamily)
MNDRIGGASTDDVEASGEPIGSEVRPLFEAAFREHHTALVRFLRRRVGNDADARDIAQETYLRVLRYRENQDLDSLKALLFRIASNLVYMRARTARAHRWIDQPSVEEEVAPPANDPSHEQRVFSEQQLGRLMGVIERLPAKCQQVFVLSRFHDMTYPQIAARLGISVKMVEKHITKALAICRSEVGSDSQ